jgi:hypothetical protein
MGKEERRRRREEEREGEVKQAVADIEWLREHNTSCKFRPTRDVGERHFREHIEFGVTDTHTTYGADAFVEERHERIERGDRIARLAQLNKTEGGREILKDAFKIANMKGAAYDV